MAQAGLWEDQSSLLLDLLWSRSTLGAREDDLLHVLLLEWLLAPEVSPVLHLDGVVQVQAGLAGVPSQSWSSHHRTGQVWDPQGSTIKLRM